jgi:hypothetical protein
VTFHRRIDRPVTCPRRWPGLLGFSHGVALAGAALLVLAWLVGRESPAHPHGVEAMLDSASSPGAAIVLAFAALAVGAWSMRHLVLHWLAWLPGRIEVAQFAVGSELTGADAEQLTVSFRRRLATLRLQAPTPVPGATPEGDFVDVLSRTGVDARNVLGSLLTLARAAKPSHAYEVRGVLLERPECPRYGVAIEVLRLPGQSVLSTTVWGANWEDVLTEAADDATSAILTRTRRCRAPWGAWRGHVMPAGLLHAYEQGARFEQQRRYDEALQAYYRAVHADPMNMALRLRLGQLQERIGLYLDALATYWGMEVASAPADARHRPLWRNGHGRRERRRALQSARYRRNVLLGGRVLAKQWRTCPDDPSRPSLRDEQRARLRSCLRPRLADALRRFADSEEELQGALAEPEHPDRGVFLSLRELFARYALADCAQLRAEMRRRPLDSATLTPASIELTEMCIDIRLTSVRHELRRLRAPHSDPGADWPPDADELQSQILRIERGAWRRLPERAARQRSFSRWHEHYNAACAYALALQDRDIDEEHLREALAKRAVCRLQKATTRADSGFIASRRDWLVSEDPDLVGLRARPEFGQFEMLFLPTAELTRPRPRNVQQLESARYVRALLVATAKQWHAAWHERAAGARRQPDIHRLHDWFGDELRTWTRVCAVALHHRHPASRFELIRDMRECADRYAFASPAVTFPRYERAPLTGSLPGGCDKAAQRSVEAWSERLTRLAEILRAPGEDGQPELLDDFARWGDSLRRLDATARTAPRAVLAQLFEHHAALWQLLEEWLDATDDDAPQAEQHFHDMAERARLLWRAGEDGRVPRVVSASG